MKTIKLGLNATKHKGYVALVDDEDYEELMQYQWFVKFVKGIDYCYARRNVKKGTKRTTLRMHCQIMNTPKGMDTDHINHDGLDNRKKNLRICLHRDNNRGNRSHRDSSSKFKGVGWHKQHKKWQAMIQFDGKPKSLGYFDNEVEAALTYDFWASIYFGEHAVYNFPDNDQQSALRGERFESCIDKPMEYSMTINSDDEINEDFKDTVDEITEIIGKTGKAARCLY